MQFSVNVQLAINGDWRQFSWIDGKLTGDSEAIQRLREVAEQMEGKRVGPMPNGFTRTNHLSNAYSAYALCFEAFPEVRTMRSLPALGPEWTNPNLVY